LLCRRRKTGGTGDENVISGIPEEFRLEVGKKLGEKLQELLELCGSYLQKFLERERYGSTITTFQTAPEGSFLDRRN